MSELTSQATSIQSLYSMYRHDKLFVNRRYQRKLVWTLLEKQRLIDSIINRYPVPAILIAERSSGDGYEIIDGLQRLHAIVSFIENGFATSDGKFFQVALFPTAKSHADSGIFEIADTQNWINQKDVSAVLDYTLAISVMRGATEYEINDVFSRINTYGHRLSDQERRQAGVENDFSQMVRQIACSVRGDVSENLLPLRSMPSISIDLPMAKHGYQVKADEVVWVEQGILRSTDLRDSMDEQCIADIAACIVGGQLIERSKDILDAIYDSETFESERINTALEVYGSDKFAEEFKFCLDQILLVCNSGNAVKLRDIIFPKGTTNAFPAVFAIIIIAFHELIVNSSMQIADAKAIKDNLYGLSKRIEIGRSAISVDERRKNIDTIKGLIAGNFVKSNSNHMIYGNHAIVDIESMIRRSEIELSDYELKQGMLMLNENRDADPDLMEKILKTTCAIANNGFGRAGKIIIGVTDKDADADRIKMLDGCEAKKIGRRFVVGVAREAKVLGLSQEEYYSKWKDNIKKSRLSEDLRDSILSQIDYHAFYGLGVIIITVPPQDELSYYGDEVYWRNGDSTEKATSAKQIAALVRRF